MLFFFVNINNSQKLVFTLEIKLAINLQNIQFRFYEIYRSEEFLLLLLNGMFASLWLTIGAAIFGFLFANLLAASRIYKILFISKLSTAFVEFTRNTPLIVQLFFIAFGLPLLLDYQWPFWAHALLALSLNFSAYFAEILRAGFEDVGKGQIEAAKSLGLSQSLIFIKIVFPQALCKVYPALNSQLIFLFLTTGIISEIGVKELTQAGIYIDSRTFRSFEVFFTLTILYILISLMLKTVLKVMYKRIFFWAEFR